MAGRHVPLTSWRTLLMAVGVKGWLMVRREILVVWALRSLAASLRVWRGGGAFAIGLGSGEVSMEVENCWRRARVDVMRSWRDLVEGDVDAMVVGWGCWYDGGKIMC
jgi:hypothetical protein